MAIDWAQIKLDVASALATALAEVQAQAFAALPIPSTLLIQGEYNWDGTDVVEADDTSEVVVYDPGDPPPGGTTPVTPASYIRFDPDGNWYKVVEIVTNVSVRVEDTFSVGSFPTGDAETSKSNGPVPSPPSSDSLKEKLAEPIAIAIFDGVKDALDEAVLNDVAYDDGNTVGPGVIV